MSENLLPISYLNDFVFCPVSIYFHSLDYETDNISMQDEYQINGSAAHEKSDNGEYSDKKNILQAISIYSEHYCLFGKIDIFDIKSGVLTERKKHISTVYDGYIFQMYAQYFALTEMGYKVKSLRLYSMDNNKVHPIKLPNENTIMLEKFNLLIKQIQNFSFDNFRQNNALKCSHCIYEPLCSYSFEK